MDDFNKISYLEEKIQELQELELQTKPLKGRWIPYYLLNDIIHTKINIIEILEEAL